LYVSGSKYHNWMDAGCECVPQVSLELLTTALFAGAQIDDTQPQRTGSRVNQPPGGKSTSLW